MIRVVRIVLLLVYSKCFPYFQSLLLSVASEITVFKSKEIFFIYKQCYLFLTLVSVRTHFLFQIASKKEVDKTV